MPNYLSPGIYVEEVPSTIKTIAGVGTSTPGFVGIVTNDVEMPLTPGSEETYTVAEALVPVRITSWEKFKTQFGDMQPGNKILAHAVYGFFNNGGTACWITRIENEADFADGIDTFEKIDEISIVATPGVADSTILEKLLSHCENMKDRFAILDGQQTSNFTKEDISFGLRNSTGGYGAIYFPWVKIFDPVSQDQIFVPPSGHIAGVYARNDAYRGVHKVPANEIIRGAVGVEHRLGKGDQDSLNPEGINVIRQFNGNITIWGGRTWADPNTEPDWKYISTRRLFNFIRESIEEGTRWVVFEPNDMSLWQKIKRNVSAFLVTIWRQGALFGNTPEQAFYVKCDEETNPQEIRELGRVVIEIGIAITKPAEFVIFRISQWSGASS